MERNWFNSARFLETILVSNQAFNVNPTQVQIFQKFSPIFLPISLVSISIFI